MPRKAKGKELTQEQLIEIKAKYECNINVQDIANEYGITREYLTRYAKKEGWIKGDKKVKALYDATKLVHEKKILTQFKKEEEKQADIVISKMAKKEGEKVALLILQGEAYKQEIEHKLAEIILLELEGAKSSLELTKGGKVTDTEFEYVDTIQGKTGKVLRKTKTLTAKDRTDWIKIAQAMGHFQIPQQQNNTQINIGSQPQIQNIPVEVATQEEADEIRKELLKSMQ